MGKVKSMFVKMATMISSLAIVAGVTSVDALCVAWFHQPKVPQGMEKFKR